MLVNGIEPHLSPEMLPVLEELKSKGHRIILISGSFPCYLDKLDERFGIGTAIATSVETKDGHFTGRIIFPLNETQGKVEKLLEFKNWSGMASTCRHAISIMIPSWMPRSSTCSGFRSLCILMHPLAPWQQSEGGHLLEVLIRSDT